ncbi:MAG: diguanylate cyclase [Xenococcaceae cyanobacterium]
MKKPVIICVDDEATVLDSLKIELKKAIGDQCIVETAEGGKDALYLLEELLEDKCEVAVVLSDYIMPDIKGDEVLKRIHAMSPNTLKIMLTGQADVEAVGNAIKHARLYRYIAKPWQPEDLKLTVVEAVHSYLQDKKLAEQNLKLQQMNQKLQQMNQELERLTLQQAALITERTAELEKANQELKHLASLDYLTKVANRRSFDEHLDQEWLRMAREKQPLSLILCDADYFKPYNDEYGHQMGDDCLKQVAQAISRTIKRPADLVARYGGEEFAVTLPNTKAEGAMKVAEAIRREIQLLKIPHVQSQVSKYVTVSLGVSSIVPTLEDSPESLIAAADNALYQAKNQGRDRIVMKTLVLSWSNLNCVT